MPEVDAHQRRLLVVFKGITLHGYYTSQIAFEKELKLEIIPGAQHGCAPSAGRRLTPGRHDGDNTYDAMIVGSGITGGWAAKELTKRTQVLILEAGRTIVPEKDYVEHVPIWELKYRGWDNRAERQQTQPVQRECYYACDEYSNKFFVNDLENPYTYAPGNKFSWIRGRQVGGKSLTWGRQSYRWSDLDFEANLREGVAVDWPIRYADIAPWYDYVEEFAGISGQLKACPAARRKIPPPDGNELRRNGCPGSTSEKL